MDGALQFFSPKWASSPFPLFFEKLKKGWGGFAPSIFRRTSKTVAFGLFPAGAGLSPLLFSLILFMVVLGLNLLRLPNQIVHTVTAN